MVGSTALPELENELVDRWMQNFVIIDLCYTLLTWICEAPTPAPVASPLIVQVFHFMAVPKAKESLLHPR